jgi:hypothetical protein
VRLADHIDASMGFITKVSAPALGYCVLYAFLHVVAVSSLPLPLSHSHMLTTLPVPSLRHQGMPHAHIQAVQAAIPEAGFHQTLLNFLPRIRGWNIPRAVWEISSILKW